MRSVCGCRPAQPPLLLLLLTAVGLLLTVLIVCAPGQCAGGGGLGVGARAGVGARPPFLVSTVRLQPIIAAGEDGDGGEVVCPPPGSVLSINSAGRLGNVMSEYATLLGVNRTVRRTAWLLPEMARTLGRYFEPPSVPVLPRGCKFNWTLVSAQSLVENGTAGGRDHLISGFPHAVPLFHPLRRQLLQEFTFRPELRARAAARLAELARRAGLRAPTFIGVHVRRTDYGMWLARQVGGHVVGSGYLQRAMALMRQRHARALFVVTSDDLDWCRQELRGPDILVAGDRNMRWPGADLALLAACNHTVVTHGTFGFWAAYLAGGEVVAPSGYGRKRTGLEQDVRRAGLGWTWLPAFRT